MYFTHSLLSFKMVFLKKKYTLINLYGVLVYSTIRSWLPLSIELCFIRRCHLCETQPSAYNFSSKQHTFLSRPDTLETPYEYIFIGVCDTYVLQIVFHFFYNFRKQCVIYITRRAFFKSSFHYKKKGNKFIHLWQSHVVGTGTHV